MTARKVLHEKPLQYQEAQEYEVNDADSWQYHYHKILVGLDCSEEEREAVIRKRILRYFGEFKLNSESYFAIRNNVDYECEGIEIIPSTIVLYGIDYMSVERARKYFKGFFTNIRRMDDSHFLVEFRNTEECLAAINNLKIGGNEIFGSPHELMEFSTNGWVEMRPYKEFVFERRLIGRYLTTMDKIDNICLSTKKSFSYAYAEAKKRFIKTLKEDLEGESEKMRGMRRKDNKRFCDECENFMCHSRSRSREKSHGFNHEKHKNLCCQGLRIRNRTKSPSFDIGEEKPKEIQEKLKESNFKFDLYIRRRNSSTYKDLILPSKDLKIRKSNEGVKDLLFDLENCCIEPIFRPETAKKEPNLNESENDFGTFLEKLNISETKKDYSAFDIDVME